MKLPAVLKKSGYGLVLVLLTVLFAFKKADFEKPKVLVFSKTEGFRHASIEAGKAAFEKMASEKGFIAEFTEDASRFTNANLKQFNAVVFLNTTGDVLNNEQQEEFERYIQAGGGYLGIHSATDCEYDWPWYGTAGRCLFS